MELLTTLQARFDAHPHRHNTLRWEEVQAALDEEKLAGIRTMEETGGEPDAIEYEGHIYYADFSEESPIARRNLAYDEEGEKERHKDKYRPAGNAHTMAKSMGAEIVDRAFYEYMQGIEDLDLKTSSWLKPPAFVREMGGALFGDKRYGECFCYHNTAKSFYASRGFRARILIR